VTSGIRDLRVFTNNNIKTIERRRAHAATVYREPCVFDEVLLAGLMNEASVDRPHGGSPKPNEKVGRALTARPTDIVLVVAS
jgi:hypothetical protein